jgi:DMSO reductase anchor subunit
VHRAWHAAAGVRSSWLSREIVAVLLFGSTLAAALLAGMAGRLGDAAGTGLIAAAAATGAALVYAMARVYRLPAVPAWDSPLTTASFAFTAAGLGGLVVALLAALAVGGDTFGAHFQPPGWLPREAGWAPAVVPLLAAAAAALACDLILERARRLNRRAAAAAVDLRLFPAAAATPPLRAPALQAAAIALAGLLLLVIATGALTPARTAASAWLLPAGLAAVLALAATAAVHRRAAFYAGYARRGM